MQSIIPRAPRAATLIVCVAAALTFARATQAQIPAAAESPPRVYAPLVTAAGEAAAAPPASLQSDWLPRVNYERALAGVPPVGEDAGLSAGCAQLAQAMVSGQPLGGLACAERASRWIAPGASATPRDALDAWMSAPEQRLWLLYPTATAFGFGFASGPDGQAAALDAPVAADDSAFQSWPVRYPGADQIGVPPTQIPLTLLWPRSGPAPELTSTALRAASGAPIAHSATAEIPGGHRGVLITPQGSLPPRSAIIIEVRGSYAGAPFTLTWQFTTGEAPGAPPAGPPPPAAPASR